jgi:hypothetical protein
MSRLLDLLRILFLRGSPERILYTRSMAIGGLAVAVCLSAAAQFIFFQDHLVFVILRVFAEVTMFMLWIAFLTAKVARLRLANAMLILVWASVLMDAVFVLVGALFSPIGAIADYAAYLWSGAIFYGAVNVIAWALQLRGLFNPAWLQVGGFVLAVWLVNGVFRYLYGMMLG